MKEENELNLESKTQTCEHCHEPVLTPILDKAGHLFCCTGCRSVYEILNENNLCDYYTIAEQSGVVRSPVPELVQENYQYLDAEDFAKDHGKIDSQGNRTLKFYLEGIHCIACLWLIEKLPDLVPGVITTRLNMSKSTVDVTLSPTGSFAMAAGKLNQLGYRPHPLMQEDEHEQLQLKEERKLLIQMGVASAAAMNIMIYAVSIYAGATGVYAQAFSWISMVLCLPVIFYSSKPFYTSAMSAIRVRSVNIDIPISFAIIFGFAAGVFNTFRGDETNYFDSIATLVFLLLFSRYMLKKAQQKSLQTTKFSQFFSRGVIRRLNKQNNIFEEIHQEYLRKGDTIRVLPGEVFPADGVVTKGTSRINTSTLTGESRPMPTKVGDHVFGGTENIEQALELEVQEIGEDTKIGQILAKVEDGWSNKSPIMNFSDKVARFFVYGVLGTAAITFTYYYFTLGFEAAFARSLALIIVTCPCALGLATPLAFTRSLSLGAKKGMIIKNEETLERINQIQNVFLDKTGTLTFGRFKVVSWQDLQNSKATWNNQEIAFAMENRSKHPIAKSITQYLLENLRPTREYNLETYEEILGVGLRAIIEGHDYELRGLESEKVWQSQIGLFEDGILISQITLQDILRPESQAILGWLREKGLALNLLSGDRKENVNAVGKELSFESNQLFAEQSPEEKSNIIEQAKDSLMVGDGANDALALTKSTVGVAVQGSVDISLRAADVYLTQPGLKIIQKLMLLSHDTMTIIYRNLLFSLIYNIAGAVLSIAGYITPLWAAVLMPLSSLTVILSTVRGTRFLRDLKEGKR